MHTSARPSPVPLNLLRAGLLAATLTLPLCGAENPPPPPAQVDKAATAAEKTAAAGVDQSAEDTTKRYQAIIIEHLEFKATSIQQAVRQLVALGRQADPKGVNIILHAAVLQVEPPIPVTLDLQHVSLLQAVRLMALANDLEVDIQPGGVLIVPADNADSGDEDDDGAQRPHLAPTNI